jgi:hypothetical protein
MRLKWTQLTIDTKENNYQSRKTWIGQQRSYPVSQYHQPQQYETTPLTNLDNTKHVLKGYLVYFHKMLWIYFYNTRANLSS